MRRIDARAIVTHFDDCLLCAFRCRKSNAPFSRAVLDRVVDDIDECLPNEGTIHVNRHRAVTVYLKRLALFLCQRTEMSSDFADQIAQIHWFTTDLNLTGIRTRQS